MSKLIYIGFVFVAGIYAFFSVQSFNDKSKNQFTVMTFNVENLFDTEHDLNKSDYTFLPLNKKNTKQHIKQCMKAKQKIWQQQCLKWDWSQKVLDLKLKRIAEVIKSIPNGGPDFLVFQEVENLNVLNQLNDNYLKQMGYKEVILIEGNDLRGIDVAILSRYPQVRKAELLYVPFKEISVEQVEDTRAILRADFKLSSQHELTIFAVHFPAPFHPMKLRVESAQFLNKIMNTLPKERIAIAAGDFNITAEENKNNSFVNRLFKPYWVVAHEKCVSCPGSYYYAPKNDWSFLDMILLKKQQSIDLKDVSLMNKLSEQLDQKGYPKSFDLKNYTGVSDHWPLLIKVNY